MGPRLAVADHHTVSAVESNVLDVGPTVVFKTYILAKGRVGESRSGTPLAADRGVWFFSHDDAVMQILQTALANVAVGIFPGADCVNSVNEPFPTTGHLQGQQLTERLHNMSILLNYGSCTNLKKWSR